MKTPKDYAKTAATANGLADFIRPENYGLNDPYADQVQLAVYHLRAAAKIVQRIAEDMPKDAAR